MEWKNSFMHPRYILVFFFLNLCLLFALNEILDLQLVNNVQPQTQFVRFMENAEFYWPAKSLAKATRIDENEMITYGFETEYCLKYILLEYHSGKLLDIENNS